MIRCKKGRNSHSKSRKIAVFLCQHLGDHKLKDIADYFGFSHSDLKSYVTSNFRAVVRDNIELNKEVECVIKYIINNAT